MVRPIVEVGTVRTVKRSGQVSWWSPLVVVTVVVLVLSGCSSASVSSGPVSGSGGSSVSSLDPDRPFEPITGLGDTPQERRAELRRRLVAAWLPLLASSGLRYQWAVFVVQPNTDNGGWYRAMLRVGFGELPSGEWSRVEAAMVKAAAANGWGQAGISHGMNLRNGSLHLNGGCGSDGCDYVIKTAPRILEKISFDPDDYKTPVAELAAYLDPAAPTPTFR